MTVNPKTEGREKPILFQGWGVRGILDGVKTQTRRVIKPQPNYANQRYDLPEWEMWGNDYPDHGRRIKCPYGLIGRSLWLRETWAALSTDSAGRRAGLVYRADGEFAPDMLIYPRAVPRSFGWEKVVGYLGRCWRPSIFMPRWGSRINLEIKDVRAERVRDIKAGDAMDEGVECATGSWEGLPELAHPRDFVTVFARLWNDINSKPQPVKRSGEVVAWASYPWSLTTFLNRYGDKVHQFEEGAWSYRPGRPTRPIVEDEFRPLTIHKNPWVWVVEFKAIERGDSNDR